VRRGAVLAELIGDGRFSAVAFLENSMGHLGTARNCVQLVCEKPDNLVCERGIAGVERSLDGSNDLQLVSNGPRLVSSEPRLGRTGFIEEFRP
jgi:hypothetical protein